MYKKIDFRVRPPYGYYMTMFRNEQAHFARLSESQRAGNLECFVREMDEAGIALSVVPGRKQLGADNGDLFDLPRRYPGRFQIFPYIDPTDGSQALTQIDRFLGEQDIRGVSAEPPFQQKPYAFDDPVAYPMYEKLQRLGLPLFISYSAKLLPVVDPDTVRQRGTVLHRFPEVKGVVGHLYGLTGAGSQYYVKAANTLMKHQMLFGTAYPILNVVDTARFYETCGIKESVLPDFFYNTAANLLKL